MPNHEARTFAQINLRVPPELRELLKRDAHKAFRSLNAEIVKRLQESYERSKPARQQ